MDVCDCGVVVGYFLSINSGRYILIPARKTAFHKRSHVTEKTQQILGFRCVPMQFLTQKAVFFAPAF